MESPIGVSGGVSLESALHELAEGGSIGDGEDGCCAVEEKDRDIKGVIDVIVEATDAWRKTRAVGVHFGPDLGAERMIEDGVIVDKGVVGQKLEGGIKAESRHVFLDSIGFVGVVDVELQRHGLFHHVMGEASPLDQIFAHDLVSAFFAPRDLCDVVEGIDTRDKEVDADLFAERADVVKELAEGGFHLGDLCDGMGRKLDLSAGFERDVAVGESKAVVIAVFYGGIFFTVALTQAVGDVRDTALAAKG